MIVVNVKAYPPFDRLLGEREVSVTLPAGATGQELLSQLGIYAGDNELDKWDDDRLRSFLYMLRLDSMLKLDNELHDGDQIALLPPISGGGGITRRDGVQLCPEMPVYSQGIFLPHSPPIDRKCYGPIPAFPIPPPGVVAN